MSRAKFITKAGALILVGLLLGPACSAFKSEGPPVRYIFPEGYVGWVRINFKKDAPPPPIEDGSYVLKFPSSGEVVISNQTKLGNTTATTFYYYSDDRGLTRMQPTSAGSINVQDIDNLEEPRHYQFVGTYEEYLDYNSRFPHDEEDEPRIGLIKKEQIGANKHSV